MALYLSSRANSTRAELPSTIKETSVVSGGLSVRATEKLVQDRLNNKKPSSLNVARRKKLDPYSLDPDILALEQSISEKTGLKVEVKTKEGQNGFVTIHYQTLDQFDDIVKKLTS